MEEAIMKNGTSTLPESSAIKNENEAPQLPENLSSGGVIEAYIETPREHYIEIPGETTGETAERRRNHARSSELERGEYIFLMAATAVCGATAGAILALSGKADMSALLKITQDLSSGFGNIFFQRLIIGSALLLAEFLVGFFALGDLFVWAAPLCCAMGLSLRITATESWILLPSAIVTLIACVMGAATSSGLSRTLMRLSRGGTVHLEDSLHVKYIISFLGYLAAVLVGAIYEGLILN